MDSKMNYNTGKGRKCPKGSNVEEGLSMRDGFKASNGPEAGIDGKPKPQTTMKYEGSTIKGTS